MSAIHPDPLSLTAWMCFISTIQCAVISLFLEQDPEAWKIHSKLGIAAVLYAVSNYIKAVHLNTRYHIKVVIIGTIHTNYFSLTFYFL